jgi:type IV pilus assembly protein PilY1
MKSIQRILITILGVVAFAGTAYAEPVMSDYTAFPPFLVVAPKPNVLILMDNSGSMFDFAYNYNGAAKSTGFNPGVEYYGYFDTSKWYVSLGNLFEEAAEKATRPKAAGEWDGNFLNWLTMRKIEIARKVLVGGKCVSRSLTGNPHDLLAEKPDVSERGYLKEVDNAELYTPYDGTRCFTFNYGSSGTSEFTVGDVPGACPVAGTDVHDVKVHLSSEPTGVIQAEGDKVRWGLAFFNESQGGRVVKEMTDDIVSSMVTAIEGDRPNTKTPLGEGLWTSVGYFAQMDVTGDTGPRYHTPNAQAYRVGPDADPYNYGTGGTPDYIWCAKSFILVITGGESTSDSMLPAGIEGYWPAYTDGVAQIPPWAGDAADNYFWYNDNRGSHFVDDVALWARVDLTGEKKYRDLRPDLDGDQYITSYFVHTAFGDVCPDTRTLLKQAARNGGFEDRNGNFVPDLPVEYDRDGDGNPDTYFEAPDGQRLADSLSAAIIDILRRTSSGTAVSILSTSAHGEGSLFQAYFKPEELSFMLGTGESARTDWLGFLHGLWVDDRGNLREDDGDFKLVYEDDNIIRFYFEEEAGTRIKRDYVSSASPYGDGTWDETNVSLRDMRSLFEAGKKLALRDLATRPRKIYTTLDGSTLEELDPFNAGAFKDYLRVPTVSEAEDVIRHTLGEDIAGMRSRKVFLDTDGDTTPDQEGVWRLGDIIYSTPAVVSRPMENYDEIYSDPTYDDFEVRYARGPSSGSFKPRPTVVYVGANDGMLHAFNAGVYLPGDNEATGSQEHGRYTETDYPSYYTSALGYSPERGQEIWAYIPHNLLPHLRWLTSTGYTHVYYVDLKPKIVDARIFTPDANHPGGWGTVLIGGLRLGGGTYPVDDFNQDGSADDPAVFSSCYFALDITNPADPDLLWEFNDPDTLGFSASYPGVARVGHPGDPGDWYVIFGSGPTNYEGTSDQPASIYVLDLKTGTLVKRFSGGALTVNSFMGGTATVDLNLDYQTNAVYVGESYDSGGTSMGKMHRLFIATPDTDLYPNPSTWAISTLLSTKDEQPITAAPGIASDHLNTPWVYWGTGRFYSELDKMDLATQGFYGVKDRTLTEGSAAGDHSASDLIDVSDVVVAFGAPSTVTGSDVVSSGAGWDEMAAEMRGTESSPTYGWYFEVTDIADPDAGEGERVLVKPSIFGGLTMFTSFKPVDDVCKTGGDGRLYAVYFETGTPFSRDIFGLLDPPLGTDLARSMDIGEGRPSSLAIHVGQEKGGKMYVQQSTGEIKEIEMKPALNPKSGSVVWFEE